MAFFSRFRSRKMQKGARNSDPIFSAATHSFVANRVTDIYGLVQAAVGLFVGLALYSFNPADPSLNTTSTAPEIANMFGTNGSYTADLLLQTLGGSSYFIALAFMVWAYRTLARKEMPGILFRLSMLALAVLSSSIFMARIPAFEGWQLGSYMGGSAGALILNSIANLLRKLLSENAFTFTAISSAFIFAALYLTALGISLEGWKHALIQLKEMLKICLATMWEAFINFRLWHEEHATTRYKLDKGQHKLSIRDAEEPKKDEDSFIEKIKSAKKPLVAKPEAPKKKVLAKSKNSKQKEMQFDAREDEMDLPTLDFLDENDNEHVVIDESSLQKNAELLQSTLTDFGIKGDITKISPGPVITLYEMEPAPGTKTSRVINLADDIARSMSALSVRVSVVPGRNAIGLELPNTKRETVFLRDILSSEAYENNTSKLPLALGKNIAGDIVIADLSRMPHLLVAGTTGSGKSVAINTMILSLIYKLTPAQCRFIMIDPKMLELSVYEDIPHLLTPVVTEPHKAISALKWAVREMEDRYRAMSKLGVRNIESFNERILQAQARGETLTHKVQTGFDPETGKPVYEEQTLAQAELPYIVVVVDEFADLMLVAGKEVEKAIQRLAQMARAAGIHLIMATQRPSVDVITGIIKSNFPTRISFQVTSKIDSRTIISDGGAEQLLGRGDMLYMVPGGKLKRVHGPFVSDDEIERVVKFLREQGEPDYVDNVTIDEDGEFGEGASEDAEKEGYDELYDQAVALVLREGKVSTSFIQRYLQIGYNRAARIVECMEREGLISPANHVGKRNILVDRTNA